MTPLDKNYLSLQFRNKIFTINGTEFQSFFEDIMQKAFPDFEKIKPYGNEGDAGNDGYIKKLGIYYQVYSPNVPSIKEAEAAKKLQTDFEKLKKKWNYIVEINKYFFVYNNKYDGSIKKLEETLALLTNTNIGIEFAILTTQKLETIFLELDEDAFLALGFNIDSRKAISNAYENLKEVELALDRGNAEFAFRVHQSIDKIIHSIEDEKLEFEYELLKYRCLQKLERTYEAKEGYKILAKRDLDDPRPALYSAELHLLDKNYDENRLILENSDHSHWLHKLEVLVRKRNLGEKIDPVTIDEKSFPDDSKKIKSNFYRIYSQCYEEANDSRRADSFVEKAIHLHPDRFSNYDTKLSLLEGRIFSSTKCKADFQSDINLFLNEIEFVERKFTEYGDLRDRARVSLLLKKLNVYRAKQNIIKCETLSRRIFELILKCYFDKHTERMIIALLAGTYLPKESLDKLLDYLLKTDIGISDDLSQTLLVQFNFHDTLNTGGKKNFIDKKIEKYHLFIEDLEHKRYDKVLDVVNNKLPFAIGLIDSLHGFSDLKKLIIEKLPDDENKLKEKLLLILYIQNQDYENAFKILKKLDLTTSGYVESRELLQVVQKKEAWDIEIELIHNLLQYEEDPKIILNLKIQLFNAYNKLKNYLNVIKTGEEILEENATKNIATPDNKEALLAYTIQAYLKRGEDGKAYETLEKYKLLSITPEFKVSIETDVYLRNNLPNNALQSIVSAIKIRKILSPEQYASLFFLLIQIDNQFKIDLLPLDNVIQNCFVKLTNQERWYFIGEEQELDATKTNNLNDNYNQFIGKRIGDTLNFSSKYSSKEIIDTVELIYSYEKYIFWQSRDQFHKLSSEERWSGARMVEVPPKDESIDTKYLEAFLHDEQEKRNPLFQLYCDQNIPLALLALNEGGLMQAIGRIVQERKGFIKCSTGVVSEMEAQKLVANDVIDENLAFYIDGTSALVLSEIGFIEKIYKYVSNIKTPQSVITMLFEVANRFRIVPGEGGTLGYARGQLIYSTIEKEKSILVQNNINSSIKNLELKISNIVAISSANKANCLSESKVHPELCDACILAQKENIPVLTEDFMYLQMNEFETQKKAPKYFSSISLMRVLYEKGKISFDDYLIYFGYLSSYRFRFLSLNADDIYKSIFGEGTLIKIKPQNLRNLNFPLTLSEDYGVTFRASFNLLLAFLFKVIMDDTLNVSITESIYAEILYSLPIDKNKKLFGRMLLSVSKRMIKEQFTKIILSSTVQEKLTKLSQLNELFDYSS